MMTIWSACYRTGEFPNLARNRCSDEDFIASEICSKNVTFPGVFIYCQVICKDRYKTSVIFWNIQTPLQQAYLGYPSNYSYCHLVRIQFRKRHHWLFCLSSTKTEARCHCRCGTINIPPLHVEHRIHHWRLFAQVKSENIISRQLCKGKCIGIHNASMLIWSDPFLKHVNFKELFSCSQTKSIHMYLFY